VQKKTKCGAGPVRAAMTRSLQSSRSLTFPPSFQTLVPCPPRPPPKVGPNDEEDIVVVVEEEAILSVNDSSCGVM
jgi:hypothetical protein